MLFSSKQSSRIQGEACDTGCTIQDELFVSFEQVLAIADKNGVQYDRIVLENSGVAEPKNIRDLFIESAEDGHPALNRVNLSTLVCFNILARLHTFSFCVDRCELVAGFCFGAKLSDM
jgi:hypothetical protein